MNHLHLFLCEIKIEEYQSEYGLQPIEFERIERVDIDINTLTKFYLKMYHIGFSMLEIKNINSMI